MAIRNGQFGPWRLPRCERVQVRPHVTPPGDAIAATARDAWEAAP